MIDLIAAQLIVERELNKTSSERLVVYQHLTRERDWGWVMFYGSEEDYYLEKDPVNNPAFLVNRVTSEVQQTGKSWPVEKYIDDYETLLGSIQN
jgi:hypothetical protein